MKKVFLNIILTALLITAALFSSACNTATLETGTASAANKFTLTEDMKETLGTLCSSVPDFFAVSEIDTNYIRDFIFASYSSPDLDPAVIKASEAQERIKLIFGLDYDVTRLVYTDTYSYCYHDGNDVIVQPSSVDKLTYVFSSFSEENNAYTVSFNMLMGDTPVGVRTFKLVPHDNENGFILTAAYRQNG